MSGIEEANPILKSKSLPEDLAFWSSVNQSVKKKWPDLSEEEQAIKTGKIVERLNLRRGRIANNEEA